MAMKALVKKRITRLPCGANADEKAAQSALSRLPAARPQGQTSGLRIVREVRQRADSPAAVLALPLRCPFAAAGRMHHSRGPRSAPNGH